MYLAGLQFIKRRKKQGSAVFLSLKRQDKQAIRSLNREDLGLKWG